MPAAPTLSRAEATGRTRGTWQAPVALIAIAIAVRIGSLAIHRDLSFDDGCYGVSTIDMRHGLLPYRDLFSSQGPLHYPLLYVGDFLSGRPLNGPRVVPVLSGIVCSIAVWAMARRLGSAPRIAFVAGAITAVTGSMLWATGPVSGDGPAAALTMCAVWFALVHRDRPAWWRPALAGAFFGAGLATKLIVFPAVVIIAWWCWQSRRRFTDLVVAGLATIAAWLAAAVPWGLGRVWDQSVAFHLDKHADGSYGEQFNEIVGWMLQRDVLLVTVIVLGLVATFIFGRRSEGTARADVIIVSIWAVAVVLMLTTEKLLLHSHLAVLVPPAALLFALRPPPWRWLVIALVVAVPLQAYQISGLVWPHGYRGADAEVITKLQALPHDARVISDVQGFVWESGHTTPRLLNDNAQARIYQHLLTTQMVADGAAEPKTCAVVMWSRRFSRNLPGLRDALRTQGYVQHVYGTDKELWLKPACA